MRDVVTVGMPSSIPRVAGSITAILRRCFGGGGMTDIENCRVGEVAHAMLDADAESLFWAAVQED